MREGLTFFVENTSLIINAMAVVVIAVGTIEIFVRSLHDIFSPSSGYLLRDRYLRYVRWLVAGLTFQLAADIIGTATGVNWDEIGRLAAVAVIRTFLNYFLDRDIAEVRKLQEKTDVPFKFAGKIDHVTIELKELKKADRDDDAQAMKAAVLKKGPSE